MEALNNKLRQNVLSVFETRYGLGVMAFLAYDELKAEKIIGHFTGGDDEATSSEDWFLNAAYPAATGDTVTEALQNLNNKIAGFDPHREEDREELEVDIINGYVITAVLNRPTKRIPLPPVLASRINAYEAGQWCGQAT